MLPVLDCRIPKWGPDLEPRDCPVCDTPPSRAAYQRPDGLEVAECPCGTWFVTPAPTAHSLDRFYKNYAQTHARWDDDPAARAQVAIRESSHRSRCLTIARAYVDPRAVRVLDVGFGRGHDMLRWAAAGASVRGVDLDEGSVDFASHHLGLDVSYGTASDEPAGSADVVLLHDIVEHPLDPVALVREAARVTVPGGLVSVWTPNGRAIQGPTPVTLRVDLEHMQYLTEQSLRAVAGQVGLLVVHTDTGGAPALLGIDGSDPRLLRRLVERAISPVRNRLGSYHLFGLLRKPLGDAFGDDVRFPEDQSVRSRRRASGTA